MTDNQENIQEGKDRVGWQRYLILIVLVMIICFMVFSLFPRPVTGTVKSVDSYGTNDGSYSVIRLETKNELDTFMMNSEIDDRPWTGAYIEVGFTYGDYFGSLISKDEIPVCNKWKEVPKSEEG